MIWYGPGDAFVVVGMVVVDAAADFDVDGIYGAGTYSFKLSLNILEFLVRRVGWTIIVCLPVVILRLFWLGNSWRRAS